MLNGHPASFFDDGEPMEGPVPGKDIQHGKDGWMLMAHQYTPGEWDDATSLRKPGKAIFVYENVDGRSLRLEKEVR